MVLRLIVFFLFLFAGSKGFGHDTIKVSSELYLLKLSEQLYVYVSYHTEPKWGRFTCNGMIMQTEEGKVWLYDTPMDDSITQQLVNWIVSDLNSYVEVLVPNHYHYDCIGGLSVLQAHNKDLVVFCNKMTYELLDERYKPLEQAYLLFEEVGPMAKMEHYYYGEAHTADNIVVWFPNEKVLFGGCMVKAASAKGMGNIADANLKKWPRTIKKVRRYFKDAEMVVPGHGEMGDATALNHTLQLLKEFKKGDAN